MFTATLSCFITIYLTFVSALPQQQSSQQKNFPLFAIEERMQSESVSLPLSYNDINHFGYGLRDSLYQFMDKTFNNSLFLLPSATDPDLLSRVQKLKVDIVETAFGKSMSQLYSHRLNTTGLNVDLELVWLKSVQSVIIPWAETSLNGWLQSQNQVSSNKLRKRALVDAVPSGGYPTDGLERLNLHPISRSFGKRELASAVPVLSWKNVLNAAGATAWFIYIVTAITLGPIDSIALKLPKDQHPLDQIWHALYPNN